MKLKKLTIHNLASIEDAVIDFDKTPLADSEVFLISGKTGAGKSTILDAICLALYGNTPRYKGTEMQGNTIDEVKISDPRQILRRNTGEGFASLTFIGNNGVNYEAKWYIKRAHKKAAGSIQKKEWTLTNLDTNLVLNKDKEIEEEIQNVATGLDFSQFCRTTMLAQGEFTKFLNSGDNERAAILEKITGLDIYSKIGVKIYEQTNSKKSAYEDAQREVKNTSVMTPEEIADKKAEIDSKQTEQQKLKAEAQAVHNKLSWIETAEMLEKKRNDAKSALDEILRTANSQEFKDKEKLCTQWTETIEARKWLNDWSSAQNTIAKQIEALKAAKTSYSELKGGEQWLRNDALETQGKIVVLTETLEAEKDREEIYGNAQTISSLLKAIEDGRSNISANRKKINDIEAKLEKELVPNRNEAVSLLDKAETDFKAKQSELATQEQSLEEANLTHLHKMKEQSNSDLSCIEHAKDELNDLAKIREEQESRKKQMADKEKEISKLKQEAEALKPLIDSAEEHEASTRETLNKQSATVNEWAKEMRAKLKVGDTCPVCGQKITAEFEHEDVLSKLLAQSEEAWKEAAKNLQDLKDKANKLNANISAQTSSLEDDKKSLENSTALSSAEQDAMDACKKCGIDTIDDSIWKSLFNIEEKTRVFLEEISDKISSAEKLEKQVNNTRKELEFLRKKKDEAHNNVEATNSKIKDLEGEINTYSSLIKNKGTEVADAEVSVRKHLADSSWTNDWNADIELFINELNSAVQKYEDNRKSLQSLQNALKEKNTNIENVAKAMHAVAELKPDWSDAQPLEVTEVRDLLNKAYGLGNYIKSAMDKQNEATSTAQVMELNLNGYYDKNSCMNADILAQLDKYSQSEISAKNSEIKDLNDQKISISTILDQSENDIKEHYSQKPVFEDNDNTATLSVKINDIEKQSKDLSESIGALNLQLQQNDENQRKLGNLIADCESKKKVYEKWECLNSLFGDATGNKFRKIAQSFVLSNLIHAANSYMRTLTERYTLKVNPGTFVIMLEDAFQGYETRAASTISGGEGFLVSLALALALSDIGNRLSVDTLFIDEGFGTLSGEPLHNAINTLRTLHSKSGRHVGIISHVEELKERIPVQIQVKQDGNNSSSEVNVISHS
ncbi:MAG: AAA family ATPase [Paludibacteraceae bacterium]|nr:AAA family ATPase [Paludibacteraceae bacterium]